MLGQPFIRDLELEDIYQREGFTECLEELAPCELNKKAIELLYFDRQHMGMRTLVAIMGDFVVGTASIIIEPKFLHNGGKVGHIEDVAVHPDFQKNGIGKQLVTELLEIAKSSKCYKVVLYCDDNLIDFYKSFGFREYGNHMRVDL